MNVDLSSALESYAVESRELLEQMESALLAMEEGGADEELVNAVFRAAHTIKGTGGLFGLDDVVNFTHDVESSLDAVRSGQLEMSEELIDLLLKCSDHIGVLVEASIVGQVSKELLTLGQGIQGALRKISTSLEPEQSEYATEEAWHISLRCGQDLLRDGMDPLGVLRYLGTLGELQQVTTLLEAIPPITEMDAETCYLGFEIDLETEMGKADIEDAFEFVRTSSQIHILPPKSKPEEWAELIQSMPEENDRLGDILVKSGALTRSELASALSLQGASDNPKPIGEILVEQGTSRQVVTAALNKQVKEGKIKDDQYVRVEAEKLDRLIDLVGELVVANTVSALRIENSGDNALIEAVKTSGRFVEEVRDAALGLRMVQIGVTFSRFQRVVRDLSLELGKKIDLIITGDETELDKTVVDRIGDPLTHLVRNSIDHGIESAEERRAKGKAEAGNLRLNAYHESGSIVIEVSDDGRGLDRQKILDKALARGLISSEEGLTDRDIFNLIFEPGFSTTEQVSNISGRGVGMDVVRRTIEELRGTVDVENHPGNGTTVRLRLPLTLAIIDGFLVGAGESRFILPMELVEECVELASLGRRDYIDLRGEVLPVLRLRDLFNVRGDTNDRQVVVVVGYAGKRAGLVVDRLLGELQTVIKPLGDVFAPLKWVNGCTVLDIGAVGLILDVPALVAKAERKEVRRLADHAAV